jgi:hypothetical protein
MINPGCETEGGSAGSRLPGENPSPIRRGNREMGMESGHASPDLKPGYLARMVGVRRIRIRLLGPLP